MTISPQAVQGPLTFESVAALHARSVSWFTEGSELTVDLGGVTRADSAGLALMVEWLSLARRVPCRVRFENVPEQVHTLVRVNGLQDLFRDSIR